MKQLVKNKKVVKYIDKHLFQKKMLIHYLENVYLELKMLENIIILIVQKMLKDNQKKNY